MDDQIRLSTEDCITWSQGAKILGVSRGSFFYLVERGRIREDTTRRAADGKYSRSDTLRELESREGKRKYKAYPGTPMIYDWMRPADMPVVHFLSTLVYREENTDHEIDYNEEAVYQARHRKNGRIGMCAFSPDRSRCYGYISITPLPEQVILEIMAGRKTELDIRLEEVETYDRPGGFTLLAISASVLDGYPFLLYRLLSKYMDYWVDQFPDRYITRIYAQTVSNAGRLMTSHFFLTPMPGYPDNSYYLDMGRLNPSRTIQRFIARLTAKAPLPDELTHPYIPPLPMSVSSPVLPAPGRQTPRPPRPRPLVTSSEKSLPVQSNLPDGLEIASVFAHRHLPEATTDQISRMLQTQRENESVPMIEGKYKLGKARPRYALDAAGRHAFYEATHEREGFEDCVDCPH